MIYFTPIAILCLWYAIWILYLAVQCLSLNRDKLAPWVVHIGMATFLVALWLDVLFNWVVMTVLFYEFPRELTISARMTRHKELGAGWRQRFSSWFGRTLLDPFDPSGRHI